MIMVNPFEIFVIEMGSTIQDVFESHTIHIWTPIEKRQSDNGASSFWLDESSQRQMANCGNFCGLEGSDLCGLAEIDGFPCASMILDLCLPT